MNRTLTILLVCAWMVMTNTGRSEEPQFRLSLEFVTSSYDTGYAMENKFTLFPSTEYSQLAMTPIQEMSGFDRTLPPMQSPRERPNQTYADSRKNPVGIPTELTLQEEIMMGRYSSSPGLGAGYSGSSKGNDKPAMPNCRDYFLLPNTEPSKSIRPTLQEEWEACGEDEVCLRAIARKDAIEEGCLSDYFVNPRSIIGGTGKIIIHNATKKGGKEGANQLSKKALKHIEKHFPPKNLDSFHKWEVDRLSGVSRGTTETGAETTFFPPQYKGETEKIVTEVIENNPLIKKFPNSSRGYHIGEYNGMRVKVPIDTNTGAVRSAYPLFPESPDLPPIPSMKP